MSTPAPVPPAPEQPDESGAPRRTPPRAVGRLAFLALAMLGGVVGLFSGLQVTRLWYLGALHLSVGAIWALVANAVFGIFGAWGMRSRDAALLPGVGWFLVVLGLLFLPHPGGDVMLPESGGAPIAFLLLGFVGIALAGSIASRIVPGRVRVASPRRAPRR